MSRAEASSTPDVTQTQRLLYVGYKTDQITVNNLSDTAQVTFTSKDETVVTVDDLGTITPVSEGVADVIVNVEQNNESYQLFITVTVKKPHITIITSTNRIPLGKVISFSADLYGCEGKVLWTVSDSKLGNINKNGLFKGKKTGKLKVTVSCGSLRASCDIVIICNENSESDFKYKKKEDGSVVITKYTGELDQALVIPSHIKGKPVTEIADDVFRWMSFTSVEFPYTLQKIGDYAFFSASISQDKPADIYIPASVTDIYDYSFSYFNNVKRFIVSPDNLKYVSKDGVLFTKDFSTLKNYPTEKKNKTYLVPKKVEVLFCTSFASNKYIKNVVSLNPDLWYMGFTFYGCDVKIYSFPDGQLEEHTKYMESDARDSGDNMYISFVKITDHNKDGVIDQKDAYWIYDSLK
jgi:hypothetical protein